MTTLLPPATDAEAGVSERNGDPTLHVRLPRAPQAVVLAMHRPTAPHHGLPGVTDGP